MQRHDPIFKLAPKPGRAVGVPAREWKEVSDMWFIFWILILFLLFSGGGYYGHRRSYYGRSMAVG